MKIQKFKILFALMFFVATSCTDNFEEINTNPNEQVNGSNSGFLLSAQLWSSRLFVDDVSFFAADGLPRWVQYYGAQRSVTHFIGENSTNTRFDINDFWHYRYAVTIVLPGLESIIRNTDENPHPNYKAVALIMKAFVYQNLVELYGPIPFSDAQMGGISEEEQFNKPKFDSEEDITKACLALLEEANTTFDFANSEFSVLAASDAWGQGDLAKWQKFGNSFRARILLRMSDADPAFAKVGLEEIFSNPSANPVISSNDENIGMTFESDVNASFPDPLNRYTEVANSGEAPFVISGFLNICGDRKDPRLKVLAKPAPAYSTVTDTYVGLPPAFDPDNPSGYTGVTVSEVSTLSKNYTDHQERPIMTYSELLFIKAESALKGINVGITAQQAYEDGITADMNELGISGSEVSTYIASPLVVYNTNNAMEQIITQRYIAQFGESVNTFSMIRRTGYPELDYFRIGTNAANNGYPVRFRSPVEGMQNNNPDNYNAAYNSINIVANVFGDKVWFAQNAPDVKMVQNLQTGPVSYNY